MARGERPEFVHLGPYMYRVTSDRNEWAALEREQGKDEHWGYTKHAEGVIYIQPDLNPALERTILLHELLHAAAFCAGTLWDGKRHEEAWVLVVAPQLLDALRSTPGLAEWLIAGGSHELTHDLQASQER